MNLTKQEQRMLNGEEGYAVRKSMEILIALGDIYGAESLIKVGTVQVAGVILPQPRRRRTRIPQ